MLGSAFAFMTVAILNWGLLRILWIFPHMAISAVSITLLMLIPEFAPKLRLDVARIFRMKVVNMFRGAHNAVASACLKKPFRDIGRSRHARISMPCSFVCKLVMHVQQPLTLASPYESMRVKNDKSMSST
jgi:hypothetical protein